MVLTKIKVEAQPHEGDYKITYHFAWWPKKVDGYKIWMEKYKKVYEWKVRNRFLSGVSGLLGKPIYADCGSWDLIKEQRNN